MYSTWLQQILLICSLENLLCELIIILITQCSLQRAIRQCQGRRGCFTGVHTAARSGDPLSASLSSEMSLQSLERTRMFI